MKRKIFLFLAIVSVVGMVAISGCKKKETYIVTFNSNGGTGTMAAQTFTEGEAQPLTLNSFMRDGYSFAGWNTVSGGSGTTYTDGQTITATADMTLYAQWTSNGTSGGGQQGGGENPVPPVPEGSPTVETGTAEVTETTVVLNGNVTAAGNAPVTARGFMYGTSASNFSNSVECGAGTGSFTANLTDLATCTTYYYKAYATNSVGTSYGEVMQFTTNTPIVLTKGASVLPSCDGAILRGNVTSNGGIALTARGFLYGTSSNNLSQTVQANGTGTGSFTSTIAGLTANTTYYYKAYATNSAGTAYGEILSFTTFPTTGTLNGHDWVDLGLPSGLRWATCNVGASTSTAYGNYYAWGETSTKYYYTEDYYTYTANPTTLPSDRDAATANWGSGWRMPTKEEFEELKNNCTVTWTTQNGVNGSLFTGPNGNSIFLPAAGYRYGSGGLDLAGSRGYYWSSSLYSSNTSHAWGFGINSNGSGVGNNVLRCRGLSVRAVCPSQN